MNFQEFKGKFEKVSVEHYVHKVDESPFVTVCVQTYNHEPYIKECLDGILMQETDFSFEILLGEDASKDGTRNICIEYAQKYSNKIRLFLHNRENNIQISGQPTGRFNFLYNLHSARGKYLALCEGDDYWTDSQKLQKQVHYMEANPECILTYHAFIEKHGEKFVHPKAMFPSTHTLAFRNIDFKIPPELNNALNFDEILRFMLSHHGYFKYVDGIQAAVKRRDSGGIWNSLSIKEQGIQRFKTYELLYSSFMGTDYEDKASLKYMKLLMRNNHKGIKILSTIELIKRIIAMGQFKLMLKILVTALIRNFVSKMYK